MRRPGERPFRYQQWAECEDCPRFLEGPKEIGLAEARLRWRAEILTFAPKGMGTRVTLRIDYDAIRADVEHALQFVSRRLQRDLDLLQRLAEEADADRASWNGAAPCVPVSSHR